jgi:ketol-acid reductoisomerase
VAAGALLLVLAGLALGDAAVSLPAGAGSEALEQVVLPTTQTLAGAFAPSSNQSWLTTGGAANGVVNLAFTQSTSTDLRSAQVTVLGQPINVFQAPPQVVANLAD